MAVLISAGVLFYYFFPHIWGSVLYPLKYQDVITKYAKQYELEPAFVASIIYAESRYNPEAISRVGAKGLMQLMPATAKSISAQLGEDKMGDLFDPETNIRYGTFYIAQKIKDYEGNKEAALAAYNGGPAVGSRYVISREAGIPKETQNFIKTINQAQIKYQELYGENLDIDVSVNTNINVMEKLKTGVQNQNWFQKIFSILKF